MSLLTRSLPDRLSRGGSPAAASAARFAQRACGGVMRRRAFGVRFWDGSELPPTVDGDVPWVVVRDPRVLAHVLREPNDLGLGRAWVAGMLDVEGDLEALLGLRRDFYGISLRPRDQVAAVATALAMAGPAALRRPPALDSEVVAEGSRHSLRRDASMVRHHYDVPDAFYAQVLGPSMVYSCAYFEAPDEPLDVAQARKLDLICRKLQLQPGDRLLDIGCGWGSLILHAARHYGVTALGVTLSPAQAEAARRRIAAAGAAEVCHVRVADYRELSAGAFDAVASVGMYEHVARRHYGDYARAVLGLVKPGGLFLNHGIAHIKPGPDHDRTFMRRFVFPDAELQPLPYLLEQLQHNGWELRDLESLREHYVLTLRRWSANLAANRVAAEQAGGVERVRVWRLYMAGAAQAFDSSEISVFQTLVARPGARHRLPLTRRWAAEARGDAGALPALETAP